MNALLLHPLKVQIVVQYRRGGPERFDLLVSPFASGEVCVRLNSPSGESSCRLQPWPTQGQESVAMRAIHSVVACFFGDLRAVPRIVGTPDWTQVTLEVTMAREEQRRRRLLWLSLTAQSPTRAALERTNGGTRVFRDEAVGLCPEDADAVYAVTRLALSSRGVAAHAEHSEPAPPRRRASDAWGRGESPLPAAAAAAA